MRLLARVPRVGDEIEGGEGDRDGEVVTLVPDGYEAGIQEGMGQPPLDRRQTAVRVVGETGVDGVVQGRARWSPGALPGAELLVKQIEHGTP